MVWSYYYLLLFGEKSGAPNIDSNLQRQIVSQTQQIIIHTINIVVTPAQTFVNALLKFLQIMLQNWKYSVLFVFVLSFNVLMHYEHQDLMSGLDQFWRCVGHTTFYDFIMPLVQAWRALYGFITPIWNLVVVTVLQLWRGSMQIFLKCQISIVFTPIENFVWGVITFVDGLIKWFGFDKTALTAENNIAVNDFNIQTSMIHFQTAINSTQVGLRCACEALDPAWDIIYAPVTSVHLPKFLDHGWNFIVRIVQVFLRIVIPPGEFPNLERITLHFYGAFLEGAFFLDHCLHTTILNIVKIFTLNVFNADTLVTPKEFVFGTMARSILAGIQIPLNLVQAIMKLFTPETIGNSAAMMDAFNMDNVWSNLHIAMYDVCNNIHWAIYLIENIAGAAATESVSSYPLPSTFECDWNEDFASNEYPHSPHMVSYTVACTLYQSGLFTIGIPLVFTEMWRELIFKSIILQEQNVLRVVQKYDGMWSSRNTVNNCEARKLRASPVNGTHRLDWTIKPENCNCKLHLADYVAPDPNFYPKPLGYRYYSEPVYNPWCGQPTIQDQILAPLEAAIIYGTRGVFGPSGIGEIMQFKKIPWDDIMGAEDALFDNPPNIPITRLGIEIIRVVIRMVLSLPDLFDGEWVYNDINCGYGLNSSHLDFRYMVENEISIYDGEYYKGTESINNDTLQVILWENETLANESNYVKVCNRTCESDKCEEEKCEFEQPKKFNMPTDDKTLRWQPCSLRSFKFPGLVYRKEDDMQECTTTNEDPSCYCNFMLKLTLDSPCGCIPVVPEVSTIAEDNALTKYIIYNKLIDSSYRWCNSNFLEWFFYMQEQMLDSMAYILAFGPWNTDCIMPSKINKDTDMSPYYLMATTTTTDSYNTDEVARMKKECLSRTSDAMWGDLIDGSASSYIAPKCDDDDITAGLIRQAQSRGTCKLWANHNLFCSASNAWRRSGDITVNVQRQVYSNFIQFLGGNFNKFNFDIKHRICDVEKAFAAKVSIYTNFLTVGLSKGPLKASIGKIALAFWEYNKMMEIKIGNIFAQFVLTFIDEIKKAATGQAVGTEIKDGVSNNIRQFVKSMVNLLMDIALLVLDAMGDFLDSISQGAGDFFRGIGTVIKLITNAITGTFLEIIGVVLDLFAEIVAFAAGKGSAITVLKKFFMLFMDVVLVLVTNLQRVLQAIFKLFGSAIGGFLNALMSGICAGINGIVCTVTLGAKCNMMTCLDSGFGRQPLGAHYKQDHKLPRLFATHFQTVDGIPAPRWVADNIDWNGTSTCDLFMEGVRFYNYTEMRPLERSTWLECLEMRALGIEIEKIIDIPEIKLYDLVYNWKRKYVLTYDMLQTAVIAGQLYTKHGEISNTRLRSKMIEINMEPTGPMKMWEKSITFGGKILEDLSFDSFADDVMKTFDSKYAQTGRNTKSAKMYRIGQEVSKTYNTASEFWAKDDMTKKGWKSFSAIYNIHENKDFQWLKESMSETSALKLPHHAKELIRTIGHHIRNKKRVGTPHTHTPFGTHNPFKKPLNTKLDSPDANSLLCPEPSSIFCLDCVIIDNLFEIVRDWANALGRFMVYTYAAEWKEPDPVTGFVQPGTLVDIENYFIMIVTNNSGFIDDTQQLTRSVRLHRRIHPVPLRTAVYNSTEVEPTQRWVNVRRDWEDLMSNGTEYFITGENADLWNKQVKKLVQGFKGLVSTVNKSYVPFFGVGGTYAVSFIFQESCDVEKAIWNEKTSQAERLLAIDEAIFVCFVVTAVLMLNGVWSVVPFGFLVSIAVLVQLNTLIYLWIVYGYLPSCQPTAPFMLAEDFVEWIQLRIAPGCFCEIWPVLTDKWCESSTCYQCGIAAGQYRNCLDDLPLAKEWGVWWIMPMMVRWLAPEAISWLAETGIVQETEGPIQQLIFDSFTSPNGTSAFEKECIWVTSGDLFVNGVALAVVGYVLAYTIMALVKFIIDLLIWLWQVFILFQWTALAIEQSTRIDPNEDDTIFSG